MDAMAKKYALNKSFLLGKGYQFRRIFSEGKKFSSKDLVLFVRRNGKGLRIGVRTPRGIGNAVKRNRARRIIKEIFRLNKSQISKQFEIVCIAREGLLHNTLQQNRIKLLGLLERAGCLESPG